MNEQFLINLRALIDNHMQLSNCIHSESGIDEELQLKSTLLYESLDIDRKFSVDNHGEIFLVVK